MLIFEKNCTSFSNAKDETLLEIKVSKAEVLFTNDKLKSRGSQDTLKKSSEGTQRRRLNSYKTKQNKKNQKNLPNLSIH